MSFVFAQKAVEEVDLSNQLLFPKIACHVFCSFVHLYKDEGRAHSTSPPQIACLKEKVAHEELRSSRDEEVLGIISIILLILITIIITYSVVSLWVSRVSTGPLHTR